MGRCRARVEQPLRRYTGQVNRDPVRPVRRARFPATARGHIVVRAALVAAALASACTLAASQPGDGARVAHAPASATPAAADPRVQDPPSARDARAAQRAALQSLFDESPGRADRYSDAFLAQIPAAQVAGLVGDLRTRLGVLQRITEAPDGFVVHFAGGAVPARITLDDAGRIAGLWFGPVRPQGDIAKQAEAIRALPGHAALLVLTDGRPRAAHAAQVPLAVGSAAKLAILQATRQAVDAGRLRWTQTVALDPRWKSPGGQLQAWPDGAPLTVDTLANLMISISDNTATDALLHLAGRDTVERLAPRNTPFPSPRELFLLKTERRAGQRDAWRDGEASQRRAILRGLANEPAPTPQDLSGTPTPDVEWFMTAEELCHLLDATADLPSLRINPGLANPADWRAVAYKGGSEAGVLNLSTRLAGRDGRTHCVVATWNDTRALDEARLTGPYRAIIAELAEETP